MKNETQSPGLLSRFVRREIDPARQSCLEGALKRGEAWICKCGQINGNHNTRCFHCGECSPNAPALPPGEKGAQ